MRTTHRHSLSLEGVDVRYAMTNEREGFAKAVEELSALVRHVGGEALASDTGLLTKLADLEEVLEFMRELRGQGRYD